MSFTTALLVRRVSADLPIVVYPQRKVLPNIRKALADPNINTKTELEIHAIMDSGEGGGIMCELRPRGGSTEHSEVILCSLTHLTLKPDEPHYEALEKYRKQRIRWLRRTGNFR